MVLLRPLVVIASVVGFVHCQTAVTIDPSTIPIATKRQWCSSQTSSCPLLCLQIPGASDTPTSNTCDADNLSYSCVCSNGLSPNSSEYSQTIPYYLCTEQNDQCVDNCAQGDTTCQYDCRAENPCGAQSPTRVNATSKTAGSTATNTAASTTSSLAPFTGVPGEGRAARPSTDLAQVYGLAIVLGGFFAGFAVLL